MPTEVGELEARVPSMAVTGLQRNVIAMAFCCKKSVGTSERQLGMNLVPTKPHSNGTGTTGITVLRRDLVVVAGADLRYVDSVLPIITTLLPLRCASACAFTTTERALHGFTITSEDLSGVVNALTCCILVSSEVSHLIAALVKRYVHAYR